MDGIIVLWSNGILVVQQQLQAQSARDLNTAESLDSSEELPWNPVPQQQ